MNIINKIVGKDISSIIYKYLTISKDEVKINHLKLCGYLKNADFIGVEHRPSIMKRDNIIFYKYYVWYNKDWIKTYAMNE
jgi:hypothetical protein